MKKKKNNNHDIPLKILLLLKKKDRPLIANHIAKGVKEGRQIVEYHLKQLVEKGILLIVEEYEKKFYILQPTFYMEDAEIAFMQLLKPWIEEFAKQTEVTQDMKAPKAEIVINNLDAYLQTMLQNVKQDLQTSN